MMKRWKLGLVVMVALAVTLAPRAPSAHAQTAWTVVASPSPSAQDNQLLGVASIAANDVWAVGRADNSGTPYSQYEPLILHWNGTAWSVIPSGTTGTGEFWGVAGVASNDVWAVGSQIEHWNGRTWALARAPSPACGTLHAVTAIAANDVWAVGANGSQTCIEHWNGKKWSVVASPSPGAQSNFLTGVAAFGPNDVWAVGNFMNTGFYITPSTPEQTLVLHWNGTKWSVVPSPSPSFSAGGAGDSFWGLTVVSGAVWAVGATLDPASGVSETLIEQWNGSSWTVVPSPSPSAQNNILYGVAAVSGSDVWAVGQVQDPTSGFPMTLIEQWDGSSWSVVPSPNPDAGANPSGGSLRGASVDQGTGQVWAVGFSNIEQTLTELNR